VSAEAGSSWSIDDAGFVTVEVFDRSQKNEIVASLSKQFGASPESTPGPKVLTLTPTLVPTIDVTRWNIDNPTIGRVFSDAGKIFQIDVAQQLSVYLRVRVLLIDNPLMPFLLLLILGDLQPEKLDRSSLQFSIRDQLSRLSLPFRLLLEKMPGLSSQGVGVSLTPRIANITWAGVTVDHERLRRLRNSLIQLQQFGTPRIATVEEQDTIEKQIIADTPLDLAGPTVKVTSHIPAFSNLHAILSEADHIGTSSRSLSIQYLTTDRGLLHSFPDWRDHFFPQFPSRVEWAPVFAECTLGWLLALNIWTTHRQLLTAPTLDQRATTLQQSSDIRSAGDKIGSNLSDVSQLGTDTAFATAEVNRVKRRSESLLNQLIEGGPLGREIPLRIRDSILSQFVPNLGNGVVSHLASTTKESLEATAEHLSQVEMEVASVQRHLSDIASLQAREASSKLEKTIARRTSFLVALTAVLVAVSFSDKLPPSLQLLPWAIVAIIAAVFVVRDGIRRVKRWRAARSVHRSSPGPVPKP
jgi:hypothetical protein